MAYVNAKITLDRNLAGATGGPDVIYCYCPDTSVPGNYWFSLRTMGDGEISRITPPTRTGYRFNGYFNSSGTEKIDGSGTLVNKALTVTATWTARWTRYLYALALYADQSDIGDATKLLGTMVVDVTETPHKFYPDSTLSVETDRATVIPTREGYRFDGYYCTISGREFKITESDGTFRPGFYEYTFTESLSLYAKWTPTLTLTLDPNGGSVSPASKDCVTGEPVGDLPDPTFAPNRFLGWFTASAGGTQVTPETTYTWTTPQTVYAHWVAPHTLTFNPMGGQTSEVSRSVFTGDTLGLLPSATKSGYYFEGWWTSEEGGTEITPETVYTATADMTVYAHWTVDEQWNLTFAANGGTVSPASKRVRPGNPVGELPDPEYGGREFLGWFTQPTGGTQYTAATVFDLHQDLTLYAHWFRLEYTLRFDPNGGTVDETERTVTINQPIGELPLAAKYANTFLGWFTAREGGEEWDEDTVYEVQDDTTLFAHWETDPRFARTLSLNAEGGAVDPATLSCTFGLPIDYLPTPEKSGKVFLGWFTAASGGTRYAVGTTCDWSGTLTLHAHWADDVFGNLTDWFGLETSDGPLMLVASTDGATRSVVETSHTGALAVQTADSAVGAFERGGILVNPVCTYRIRKSGTVQLKIGKAYGSATITGTGSTSNPYRVTKSGYMLVSAEYGTAADGEPVLVVRGMANEGYVWTNGRMVSQLTDAINQWTVNLAVNPDHIAQDPMNAVSGGGDMTECKTLVTCDPIVPTEGGMPCASDIVHGKIVVTATTNAYFGESAPTARGSFVETNGAPPNETDVDFTIYAFSAERSL